MNRGNAFVQLLLVLVALATLARAAGPVLEAPSGWRVSWSRDHRLSNGASNDFISLFTVDQSATAVTQDHLNTCVQRCATTKDCAFVNLVKQTGSTQGNVVCLLFPHYIASTKATYITGVQKSGGMINYSYGVRSLCTPVSGGAPTCTPATITTTPTSSTTTSSSSIATSTTTLGTSGKVVNAVSGVVAPNGWKLSWNKAGRLSNGASTKFISLFTVDRTATTVTQSHINACVSRCSTTSKCGFVNLIQMTGSSQGNIVCMLFPKYFASTLATYTTGPQKSGGRVLGSYGIRSLCTPTNGGALTCAPAAVSATTTSATTTTTTTMVTVRTTSTTTSTTSSSTTTTSTASASNSGLPLPKYNLVLPNRGAQFFSNNNWDFWNWSDPTHGTVQYVDQPTAQNMNLIGINSNNQAFVRSSYAGLPLGQYRPSVRFQTKNAYDAALVVVDVASMPIGCATWPAIWTVAGATWPENGEIDIMEGIGYTSQGTNANLMSVHMNGSSVLTNGAGSYTGKQTSNQCMTNYGLGNTGCSYRDTNANGPSWGQNFNSNGGGIWVALWGQNLGVRIWFWGRNSGLIPAELQNPAVSPSTLNPSSWGTPMANFQSPLIDQKLNQQNVVLDLTINGDWAGNVPMDNTAQCGTNHTTALAVGSNYYSAQFVLNGIDVYTSQ